MREIYSVDMQFDYNIGLTKLLILCKISCVYSLRQITHKRNNIFSFYPILYHCDTYYYIMNGNILY